MTKTATDAWISLLSRLAVNGKHVSPRGKSTIEIMGARMQFDMNYPIVCVPSRRLGTAFLAAEPSWILSGNNRLDYIANFADMGRFSDDGIFLSGSYGPKVVDAMPYIVKCLTEDPYSRQAIINIWRDKPASSFDTPCTLSYQFVIRDNLLNMIVMMRSNDVYLGNPYDVFTQTMVSLAVCLLLRTSKNKELRNLELGSLFLMIGSCHAYGTDLNNIHDILKETINMDGYYNSNVYDVAGSNIPLDYQDAFESNMGYSDLINYLDSCAIDLKYGSKITYGFLKGLNCKNSKVVMEKL